MMSLLLAMCQELLLLLLMIEGGCGLNNGVALTPPMGWMVWMRFHCNTNCTDDPHNCLSEKLIKQMADIMAADGYKEAGYEYVAIDDCWMDRKRDSQGRLVPDPIRFPSGMKALADYIHSKGLKLGMYEAVGTKTCAGYPGSYGHLDTDAETFANWGVDMIKLDGCYGNKEIYTQGFPAFRDALNKTGHHMVYSCEWPFYARGAGQKTDYKFYQTVSETCNMFRVLGDTADGWQRVTEQISYFGHNSGNFQGVTGSGSWGDPDQMVIGDFGLSHEEEKAQMALYAMLAAPLIVSNDLRAISNQSKAILLNKRVIAINQDPLGIPAQIIMNLTKPIRLSVWRKPLLPEGTNAIAFLYLYDKGNTIHPSFSLQSLGLLNKNGYNISEVFDNVHRGFYKASDSIKIYVNPSGVYLIKASPLM